MNKHNQKLMSYEIKQIGRSLTIKQNSPHKYLFITENCLI